MELKICTNCVMDTTDPDITFNENGVCNHCIEYQAKEQKRKFEKLEKPWVYENLRKAGKNNTYDCLIGLSGGVDSSLCLHYLVENGIRPLCFSVDNGWNSPVSDENIMGLVETLKVPFYRYTIDLKKFNDLQIAFLRSGTPNAEIPTDHILMATTYEMAAKNGIKWIISGGNLATESIMPKAWGYQARDLRFIKSVYKAFTGKRLSGLPLLSLFQYLKLRYLYGIQVVNLLDYYDYNREDAKRLLAEKYGWKDYGEKHEESKFTKWFQDCYLMEMGIDKRKAHYSSLINSGQMTREEALKKLSIKPKFYPLQVGDDSVEYQLGTYPKSYQDYPNSEKIWKFLSRIKKLLPR